jgi:hypothetical protein
VNNPDTPKASGRRLALRHVRGVRRHCRSNLVGLPCIAIAVGSGGSYAVASTASNVTIAVRVDKGSGVMHLAKHPRCGRGQSRIGLSSALDRPSVSAWATANVNGGIENAEPSPQLPTPTVSGTRPDQAGGSGTRQATPGPSPSPERIRRAFVL